MYLTKNPKQVVMLLKQTTKNMNVQSDTLSLCFCFFLLYYVLFLFVSLIAGYEDPEFAWYLYARIPRVPVVSKKLRTYKNIREVWIIHLLALFDVAI